MYTETQQQLLQWDKRPMRAAQADVPWGGGAARPAAAVELPPGLLFYVLVHPDQPASITIVTMATKVRHYAPRYGAIYQECCRYFAFILPCF